MTAAPEPVISALRAVADLMDRDNERCRALYGAPVGIPPSMVDSLITRACLGPSGEHTAEWTRIAREKGMDAAMAWGAAKERLRQQVAGLVYPHGLHTGTVSADEVRATADRLDCFGIGGEQPCR